MKISISATNPCHMYPIALELAKKDALGCYYSGYPQWKLPDSASVPVRDHSWRTNCVYGAFRFFPRLAARWQRSLFLWQDHAFDAWVGKVLGPADFIHAMPGQALATFKRARQLGIPTVLNHATGPVRDWVRILRPEYERVGLRIESVCPYDAAYFEREDQEYALADFHCAASRVVAGQLEANGIGRERILLVPYGADASIFHPPPEPRRNEPFRIVFAGQASLRKGVRTVLQAFHRSAQPHWTLDFFGTILPEANHDLKELGGDPRIRFHGAVSQSALANAFRRSSVLVLPSLEEGFGLVVPQALSTGLPCIVSDRTGAKDLIRHHQNGSICPAQDAPALAAELTWWSQQSGIEPEPQRWSRAAEILLEQSAALTRPSPGTSSLQTQSGLRGSCDRAH